MHPVQKFEMAILNFCYMAEFLLYGHDWLFLICFFFLFQAQCALMGNVLNQLLVTVNGDLKLSTANKNCGCMSAQLVIFWVETTYFQIRTDAPDASTIFIHLRPQYPTKQFASRAQLAVSVQEVML